MKKNTEWKIIARGGAATSQQQTYCVKFYVDLTKFHFHIFLSVFLFCVFSRGAIYLIGF